MGTVTRYFKEWTFKRNGGKIQGLRELAPERLPREHCRLFYNDAGQLVRIEEYTRDKARPAVKLLGYESSTSTRILSALDYDPDGNLRLTHTYVYDEKGRMADRIETDGQHKPRGHVTSAWDENGNEIEERWHNPDGHLGGIHRYSYDSKGQLIEENVFDPNETLVGTRKMQYDESGNLILKEWYGPEGILRSRFTHEFDSQGNLLKTSLYGSDGTLQKKMDFQYDEEGNPHSFISGTE